VARRRDAQGSPPESEAPLPPQFAFSPLAPLDLSGGEVVTLTLAGVLVAVGAFIVGRMWARWMGHRAHRERTEKMFQIEKSLSDFYEHEKKRFLADKQRLEDELGQKEKEIEELRRKAAGVTGRGKDARADLMMQLLVENEALQEKLFEENVRQKDERDRTLKRELQQISYQRVLLSRLLAERGVQEAVVEILGDDRRVEELRAATPKLEALPDVETERDHRS